MLDFKSGYIEVWRDGVKISQHRLEREAIESVLNHCKDRPSGEYELLFPVVRIIYTAPVTPPVPEPEPEPEPPGSGTINGGGPFMQLDSEPGSQNAATWANGVE